MKLAKYFVLAFGMSASSVMAFTMPSAPSNFSTYDEIRTTDGATCRSANGGNFIVHGGVSNATGHDETYYNHVNSNYSDGAEKGVYLGFAFTYGGGKKINCSRLANIEFAKAELELKKLRAEISALEQIKALQSLKASGDLPPLE